MHFVTIGKFQVNLDNVTAVYWNNPDDKNPEPFVTIGYASDNDDYHILRGREASQLRDYLLRNSNGYFPQEVPQ